MRLLRAFLRRFPTASDNRLLQFTAECHADGINEKNLTKVTFDRQHGLAIFEGDALRPRLASVDLKQPSPSSDISIQRIELHGRQGLQQQQAHSLQGHINAQGQQGPIAGGAMQ